MREGELGVACLDDISEVATVHEKVVVSVIVLMSIPRKNTGNYFTQLVGYDYVVISQELLDTLNECRPFLCGSNIVALCMPKLEYLRKSHGDGCFSLI